ncbi:unnamed protein product [Darwinula stevensoni]|uniref:Vesicle transport protein n=1 Tax=Darwinula stevensoni TaxID=69355 RepID=A0A7R8X1P7_9CRUS|nr:unnamed protein product [Darwinula stevensoni]CAG0882982.1 unnamed protein product [Darwinula stevensoni]
MDKLRRVLNGNEEADEERGTLATIVDSSTLSWSTRVKGFIACFILGWVISLLGVVVMFISGGTNLLGFALLYTFGNVVALSSTFFLMGPWNQLKKMFAATRAVATVVMLVALILTLLAAIWWKNKGLVILFLIIQFFSMLWYSLSYIPFARDAVLKCFGSCLG